MAKMWVAVAAAVLLALAGAAQARRSFAQISSATVAVFKHDGTQQCGLGKEVTLANMAASLEAAGVTVLASRKADDGKQHIQLCGAPTGRINVFEIPSASRSAAQKLGFDVLIADDR